MKYIMKKKMVTLFVGMAATITMAGCSTSQEIISHSNILIEKVSSMEGKITQAGLYKTESNIISLRGKLKRQFFVRNAQVPGHLRFELLDLKGKAFKEIEFNYGRKSNHSDKLSFSIPIPVSPKTINKVRVIHHQASSHNITSNEAVWRDVKLNK